MMKPCSSTNLSVVCSLNWHVLSVCITRRALRKQCLLQRQRSWLSKRLGVQWRTKANNLVGPQRLKIGGEANGEVEVEADSVEDARQVVVEGLRVEIGEVVLEGALGQ